MLPVVLHRCDTVVSYEHLAARTFIEKVSLAVAERAAVAVAVLGTALTLVIGVNVVTDKVVAVCDCE